jgi:hypothetical protein
MHRLSRILGSILACAVLLVSAPTLHATGSDWSARYDRLVEADARSKGASTQARAAMITAHYAALFPPLSADRLHTLSAQDAALGFRAANMAHFYSLDEHHLAQMRAYFERLSQLGAVSASQLQDMAGAYIASRHWQQARALREAFPSATMASVPSVIDTVQGQIAAPGSVLSIGPTAGAVTRVAEDITQGPVIVAISHPLCHFSRAAYSSLASDPALAPVKAHVRWIAPVDRDLNLDVLQRWNAEHPDAVMTIAYSRSQWPQLENWGTPTFYFLKDGKLLRTVEGWPEAGRKQELLDAARAIGL